MELEKYKANESIIRKVVLQLQKDFQIYDEEIHFSGIAEKAYQELFEQIVPVIDRMLNLDSARFFSLLYAIDVDEGKVKNLLFGDNDIDTAMELSHLILERELLKVVSRHIYSLERNIKTFGE